MRGRRLPLAALALIAAVFIAWGAIRIVRSVSATPSAETPSTRSIWAM